MRNLKITQPLFRLAMSRFLLRLLDHNNPSHRLKIRNKCHTFQHKRLIADMVFLVFPLLWSIKAELDFFNT